MAVQLPIDPAELIGRFGHPAARALVVMGSYARGDAGPYSDIDLARFAARDDHGLSGDGSHLIDDTLVVVGTVGPADVAACFERPEHAVESIAGLRAGQALHDPDGLFAAIQRRARAFVWDAAMQARADAWASAQMVGWVEEVHKGLEGLRRGDAGRMLNARHGCSWGLSRVVQVQRGILLGSDNAFFDALAAELGPASEWVRLRRAAFGVEEAGGEAPTLREQVRAGLALYRATAELLGPAIQPADRPLIERAVARISAALVWY
ncbi:nucleotidyltransferase domain-containing protein [Kouleothrix sp.]|uniref:nucleotidyltransferase domain-containing protein n=1 Tax=Kouleothrix sp. TaxID=2779161 RepID=UPI00391B4A78